HAVADGDCLTTGGAQDQLSEPAEAGIGRGEGVVGRQRGTRVRGCQADRPAVAGGRVAEWVTGPNAEREELPWGNRVRCFNAQLAAGGGVEGDPRLRSGKRAIRRVGDGDRLRAGRSQRGAESADAIVAGLEAVKAGQDRLAIAAAEAHDATVAC